MKAKPFELYDRENPQIWLKFESIALNLIHRGVRRYGSKAIFEIIRYQTIVGADRDDYKINNNYTAAYARKWQQEYPQYREFFSCRSPKGGKPKRRGAGNG